VNSIKLRVLESEFWEAFVMPDQRYLGRLVVVLKQDPPGNRTEHLRHVSPWAWAELLWVVDVLERALAKAFEATMFNWSCLMNDAYQDNEPQPHVHWHFRPRYSHPVEFADRTWEDPNFGHHYLRELDQKMFVDPAVQELIAEQIRSCVLMCRA